MNIILVIFDSMRQDHIGAYGNDWINTPNLDAFAKESVVFTRCYADSLPTLPVRRALHTGKRVYPFRDLSPVPAFNEGINLILLTPKYVRLSSFLDIQGIQKPLSAKQSCLCPAPL